MKNFMIMVVLLVCSGCSCLLLECQKMDEKVEFKTATNRTASSCYPGCFVCCVVLLNMFDFMISYTHRKKGEWKQLIPNDDPWWLSVKQVHIGSPGHSVEIAIVGSSTKQTDFAQFKLRIKLIGPVQVLHQENQELTGWAHVLHQENQELSERVYSLQQENSKLKKQILELKKQISKLQDRVQSLQDDAQNHHTLLDAADVISSFGYYHVKETKAWGCLKEQIAEKQADVEEKKLTVIEFEQETTKILSASGVTVGVGVDIAKLCEISRDRNGTSHTDLRSTPNQLQFLQKFSNEVAGRLENPHQSRKENAQIQ